MLVITVKSRFSLTSCCVWTRSEGETVDLFGDDCPNWDYLGLPFGYTQKVRVNLPSGSKNLTEHLVILHSILNLEYHFKNP